MIAALLTALMLSQAPAVAAPPDEAVKAAEEKARLEKEAAQLAQANAQAAAAAQKLADAQKENAPKAEAKPEEHWTGLVGFSGIWLTGNAQNLTAMLSAAGDRKFGPWGLQLRAGGAYGQNLAIAPGSTLQVTALRADGSIRGARDLKSWLSLYAVAGLATDHVQSVEFRGFGELGLGFLLWDEKEGELEKALLRLDLGFRYQHDLRFQYYASASQPVGRLPDGQLAAPRLGLLFRYAINSRVRLVEEAQFLPNVLQASRFIVASHTKLSARFTENVALTAGFLVTYDTLLASVGKRTTDTALTAGLEVAF